MRIAELPAPVTKFSKAREEPGLVHSVPGRIDLNFLPGSRNNCKLWRQRVDTQIIAPFQIDMLEAESDILDSVPCRCAVRRPFVR